jgi:PIN domain nuclease of toxin-antitoxin system
MRMTVVDASALLAWLKGEKGSDAVERELAAGGRVGAANWSEVAQKILAAGRDWGLVRSLLASYSLRVEPVVVEDAEWAAQRWRAGEGLSLADRLCLALAERYDEPALTADTSWGHGGRIRQVR